MRLLVAIASYGRNNDAYLERVLAEYRSMAYDTHIVVLSNISKDLGPDVEVRVGLPDKNPYSLPFAHKTLFAEFQNEYDLFVYAEDDMLVTQRNIEAVLRVSSVLGPDELPGFFQYETYPDGTLYYPAVNGHFHWYTNSFKRIGDYTFARFSNEHTACFLLTQKQLKRAISSGGFLLAPYEARYQIRETASTDPYTRCGFTKWLCLSHFDEFLVAHLPNRYIETDMGLAAPEFYLQIEALLHFHGNGGPPKPLLEPETKLLHSKWSKSYYERPRHDLLELVPAEALSVLSVGCGWGETEASLLSRGVQVVGIPLDPVIAACAQARGVEIICGDLDSAVTELAGRRFDAVLMSSILHLFPNPAKALSQVSGLLAMDGTLIADILNLRRLAVLWQRLRPGTPYPELSDYESSGLQDISRRQAFQWFRKAGLVIEKVIDPVPSEWKRTVAMSGGMAAPLFSREYIVRGRMRAPSGLREPTSV